MNHDSLKDEFNAHFTDDSDKKPELPNKDMLLSVLEDLDLMTVGQSDRFFCNLFLNEMAQLLKNSIRLYEEGFFDAAFYSIRQAQEVGNSMLLIADKGPNYLKQWDSKGYFPMNASISKDLKKIDEFYREVHDQAIPRFFAEQDALIQRCHKIIHKQGYDTFYTYRRCNPSFNKNDEIEFFEKVLKHTMATIIILYIVTDPISLVLADSELSTHFNFDPMCEPANVSFIEDEYSPDLISSIKSTNWFSEFSKFFLKKEKMLPEVTEVIREQFFDISRLETIAKQSHLLNTYESIILTILLHGCTFSVIYPDCSMLGYYTSIRSNYYPSLLSSHEFEQYQTATPETNIPYHGMFRSVFYGIDSNWVFDHNDMIDDLQQEFITHLFQSYRDDYNKIMNDYPSI